MFDSGDERACACDQDSWLSGLNNSSVAQANADTGTMVIWRRWGFGECVCHLSRVEGQRERERSVLVVDIVTATGWELLWATSVCSPLVPAKLTKVRLKRHPVTMSTRAIPPLS